MIRDQAISTLREMAVRSGNDCARYLELLSEYQVIPTASPEFEQMKQNLLQILATTGAESRPVTDNIFVRLQQSIAAGTEQREFPVGTELPDTWTDDDGKVYQIPHIIADYRQVELVGGKKVLGAILMRKYVLPTRIPFSRNGETIYSKSDLNAWLNCNSLYEPLRRYGYELGCSAELLKSAAETVAYTPYKEDDGQSKIDTDLAKFFVPSAEELHIDIGNDIDLDIIAFMQFVDTIADRYISCKKRTFRGIDGQPQCVWLRSRINDSYVYFVYPNGRVTYDGPSDSLGVLAACVIAGKD